MEVTIKAPIICDFDICIRHGNATIYTFEVPANNDAQTQTSPVPFGEVLQMPLIEKSPVEHVSGAIESESVAAASIEKQPASHGPVLSPLAVVPNEEDKENEQSVDLSFDEMPPVLQREDSFESIPDRQVLPFERKRLPCTPIARHDGFKLPRYEYPRNPAVVTVRSPDAVQFGEVENAHLLSSRTGLIRWNQNRRYQKKKQEQRAQQ